MKEYNSVILDIDMERIRESEEITVSILKKPTYFSLLLISLLVNEKSKISY